MANPAPDQALGKGSVNHEAKQSWTTFSNRVNERSEIPEWKKSRWCVSKNYDGLICEAVDQGYECYEELPEEMQFQLVMEIIKTERFAAFCDYGDESILTDCLTQILLKKGSLESFAHLYAYLHAHFIQGYGNKPACFADTINAALDDQWKFKVREDEAIRFYGDPDDSNEENYPFSRR